MDKHIKFCTLILLFWISPEVYGKSKFITPDESYNVTDSDVRGVLFARNTDLEDVLTEARKENETMKTLTPETGLDPGYQYMTNIVLKTLTYLNESRANINSMTQQVFRDRSIERIKKCYKRNKLEIINVTETFDGTLECRLGVLRDLNDSFTAYTEAIKQAYDVLTDSPVKIHPLHFNCGHFDDDRQGYSKINEKSPNTNVTSRRRRSSNYLSITNETLGTGSWATVYDYSKTINDVRYKIVRFIKKGTEPMVKLVELNRWIDYDLHMGDTFQEQNEYGCSPLVEHALSPIASDVIGSVLRRARGAFSFVKNSRMRIRGCLQMYTLGRCQLPIKPAVEPINLNIYDLYHTHYY